MVIGSRPRIRRLSTGVQTVLIIRRLRCTPCRRIHHELPDCLVPYKRYDAASIEAGLTEGQTAPVAVDESTLNRWRRWYAVWVVYTAGCLAALAARSDATGLERQTSRSFPAVLQLLGPWVGDAPQWLARAVRPLANHQLWPTDLFGVAVRRPDP